MRKRANRAEGRPVALERRNYLAGNLGDKVETVAIKDLILNPKHARKHSSEQLHRLERCLVKYGFLVPVLKDASGHVICGHARIAAANMAGITSVPALTVSGLTEAQIRAFTIAENRMSDLAAWDYGLLREHFEVLLIEGIDIEDTGFQHWRSRPDNR